jgi:hypothetical protein
MKIRWENEQLSFIPESPAQVKQLAQYFEHITAGAKDNAVGFGVLDVNRALILTVPELPNTSGLSSR